MDDNIYIYIYIHEKCVFLKQDGLSFYFLPDYAVVLIFFNY